MNDDEGKRIEKFFYDFIQERPQGFTVNDGGTVRYFYVYPVTLGKMLSLHTLMEQLGLDAQNIRVNEMLEILRIVNEKREICLSILFIHMCKNCRETHDIIFDEEYRQERIDFFNRCLSDEDIATLMMMVLISDKTGDIIKYFGIDREQEAMHQVMKVKENKNNISFGGKSLLGSFIQPLIEMGLDYDEIVWVRSYSVLRILLADKVNSIYLSDEELSKVPAHLRNHNDDTIKATKENINTIKAMNWK